MPFRNCTYVQKFLDAADDFCAAFPSASMWGMLTYSRPTPLFWRHGGGLSQLALIYVSCPFQLAWVICDQNIEGGIA